MSPTSLAPGDETKPNKLKYNIIVKKSLLSDSENADGVTFNTCQQYIVLLSIHVTKPIHVYLVLYIEFLVAEYCRLLSMPEDVCALTFGWTCRGGFNFFCGT